MAALATLKRRSRNSERGSIGCAVRASQETKPATRAAAAANEPSTSPSVQPRSAPSMIP